MSFLRRMPTPAESLTQHYLASGGNRTPGAMALLAEADRERAGMSPDWSREHHERQMRDSQQARERFLEACRPATAADYAAWLSGWLARGGQVTHIYDYEIGRADWWVMDRYASPPKLYGAQSVNVIVPDGVPLRPANVRGNVGHNSFFFMDGFAADALWVPSYTDVDPLVR